MLINQTKEKLYAMRLSGMASGLDEMFKIKENASLSFEEKLSLLVDKEWTLRENRKLSRLLREAKFKENACLEDLDYRQKRELDKNLIQTLANCNWLEKHHNLIIAGATGSGKTYLSCALGNSACRQGYKVYYSRLPRLLEELRIAKADGSYIRLMNKFARAALLILDDFGLNVLDDEARHNLLEIVEDRQIRQSTLIASQLPIEHRHEVIGNPTIADAILDRLIHNAYKIELKGGSMRKIRSDLTTCRPL